MSSAVAPIVRGFDLCRLSVRDVIECGRYLRAAGEGQAGFTAAGEAIVSFLHERLVDEAGQRASVLTRLFKTHPYHGLGPELKSLARSGLQGREPAARMNCLVLVATKGSEPAWNDRRLSHEHRVIPLRDADFIRRAPMISRLMGQLGLTPEEIVAPDPALMRERERKQFNVFFVPEAGGSPYVPAQEGFVAPHQVRSVLGFGGSLPSGNVFAVILFLRAAISPETADLFKPLALSVKAALLDYKEEA